jgi:hypothetical protein
LSIFLRCNAEKVYHSLGYLANEIGIQKDMMDLNRTIMNGLRDESQVLLLSILFIL